MGDTWICPICPKCCLNIIYIYTSQISTSEIEADVKPGWTHPNCSAVGRLFDFTTRSVVVQLQFSSLVGFRCPGFWNNVKSSNDWYLNVVLEFQKVAIKLSWVWRFWREISMFMSGKIIESKRNIIKHLQHLWYDNLIINKIPFHHWIKETYHEKTPLESAFDGIQKLLGAQPQNHHGLIDIYIFKMIFKTSGYTYPHNG